MEERIIIELKQLFEKMNVEVTDVKASSLARGVTFSIETPDAKLLIGPQGSTLEALTYLVRRVAEKKIGDVEARDISIDVNGYREKRSKELKGVALMLGERARTFKHEVELEPMSSYERLIVHSVFESDPSLTTESRGVGKARHVVIKYTEDKKLVLETFGKSDTPET